MLRLVSALFNPGEVFTKYLVSLHTLKMNLTLRVLTLLLALPAAVFAQDSAIDLPGDSLIATIVTNPSAIPNDAQLAERLNQLSNACVTPRVNAVVKGYIKTYVQNKPEKTRSMLGRRMTYFPLFEEKLREYGLPNDLKYLAVVESALNPKAVSRVGATGLWQFMPYTGIDYGLQQNGVIDERIDPVQATDAAARYLKHLYKQYNDWALALAAYNSGPTRVNSAIKKAHSNNFWVIQRYLPEETRNYVPAFIAASYICNYFPLHGLTPYDPDFDQQITSYIKIHDGVSFSAIAQATGIDYGVIAALNPGYKRYYVPSSKEGNYVTLPQRVMGTFVQYLNGLGANKYALDENMSGTVPAGNLGDGRYWQTSLTVQKPDHVARLAQALGVSTDHLKAWNNLISDYLYVGQQLKVWRPVIVQRHANVQIESPAITPAKTTAPAATKPTNTATTPPANKPKTEPPAANKPKTETTPPATKPAAATPGKTSSAAPANAPEYQWHTVGRNESLQDIARLYNVPLAQLRTLNGDKDGSLQFGARIKVKQL
jgi:membrane-bound lytic murein transglycosylase D